MLTLLMLAMMSSIYHAYIVNVGDDVLKSRVCLVWREKLLTMKQSIDKVRVVR